METVLPFVFIFSLGVSFMLSGLEAGLFSLSRWRIRHQMRQGNRRAELLYGYLEHPEKFLWTILVGNSLANLVIFSALVFWFYQWLGPWPALLILSLAVAVLLFYGIFELLPKTVFRAFPNRFCMWMAVPFRFLYILFRPLVALLVAIAGNFPRGAGEARIFGHLFRQTLQKLASWELIVSSIKANRLEHLRILRQATFLEPLPVHFGLLRLCTGSRKQINLDRRCRCFLLGVPVCRIKLTEPSLIFPTRRADVHALGRKPRRLNFDLLSIEGHGRCVSRFSRLAYIQLLTACLASRFLFLSANSTPRGALPLA